MNEDVLRKIAEKWKDENLLMASPYSETQVRGIFHEIGKPLSKDVLEIYTTLGSLRGVYSDNNLLSFWTLEDLTAENAKLETDFTLFGDFLIFSHLYGYKYENENVSSVYGDFETGEYLKIADSVEEFFALYLNDPWEIGLYRE